MAFLALLIAVVFIVAAIRDTHLKLLSAIGQDVPGFAVWGAAIFGLAVIGFIPGLRPVSRGLLALVIVVIVLTNYKQIIGGFQNAWQGAPAQAKAAQQTASKSGGSGGPINTNAASPNLQSIVSSLGSYDFTQLLGADNSGGSTAVNG